MTKHEFSEFNRSYTWTQHFHRLSIHQFILSSSSSSFVPINALRNIAISRAQTSHVWMTDFGVIPSDSLYEVLTGLPRTYLEQTHLALVIPAFSIHYHNCDSIESCEKRYYSLHSFIQSFNQSINQSINHSIIHPSQK